MIILLIGEIFYKLPVAVGVKDKSAACIFVSCGGPFSKKVYDQKV